MEHGQSGEQDDGWNPEMNVGEDHCPHRRRPVWWVFTGHGFASVL